MRSKTQSSRSRPRRAGFSRAALAFSPVLLLGACWTARAATPAPAPQADYAAKVRPVLQQFCYKCHGPGRASAGINLESFAEVTAIQKDQATWRKVMTQIRDRSMPPKGVPQPSEPQRDQLLTWIHDTLENADESLIPKNPGRVLIHRLSRLEYNNTVRDLFGVNSHPADRFPADGGGGGGFDNNADTLFIPPILMERYLDAAGEVLEQAPKELVFFVKPSKKLPARDAAHRILSRFAMRGFRRPLAAEEMTRLMGLYDQSYAQKSGWESSVKFALKAVLVSPNFLFRIEKDHPGPDNYPVSEFEMASRLSYFLWSSMPDEALLQLAAQKKLHDPKVLDQQVARMLKDPKGHALADSFIGQWLRTRELYTSAQPDPRRFPTYTPALRDAMYGETAEFFASVLRENESLLHLLDADYTYLNEDLAKLYGVSGVTGPELRRVSLGDKHRGGVLTMASVLTVTSYPQRTSPVLRGKWVLEEMLGSPVPPPPPNAGGLPADDRPKAGQSFRQQLEAHRAKPQCASCHARMDPIGFGLENFDAIGRWRTEVGGQPVDSAGVLATGEKFSGPQELKSLLMQRKEEFLRNLTEKMLAYSLGRGLEPYDIPAVRRITTAVSKDDYRSTTLIREIVKSYPFQYRRNG